MTLVYYMLEDSQTYDLEDELLLNAFYKNTKSNEGRALIHLNRHVLCFEKTYCE